MERKRYCVIFNTSDTTDSAGKFDDLEEALGVATEIMWNWKSDEMRGWLIDDKGVPHPTEEQIESWDMMIEECCAYVAEWNEESQDYYNEKMDYDFPSEEDVEWLSWEEMKEKYNW